MEPIRSMCSGYATTACPASSIWSCQCRHISSFRRAVDRAGLAYVPESRQLVVEYELPPLDVVTTVREYRCVKIRDEITASARPAKDIRERCASVVSQVSLRTLHEVFEADRSKVIDTVAFNGIVDTTDPGTGKPVQP